MWQQWINALLGLWVLATPFLNMTAQGLTWSLVISGIVIAALGIWGAMETSSERATGQMRNRLQHQ